MLRYGEFDVAEMSTGSFLMARDKGAPRLIGIPVFPSKTFRHSCIYINTDSGIQKPADMSDKRVGVPEYQITMRQGLTRWKETVLSGRGKKETRKLLVG